MAASKYSSEAVSAVSLILALYGCSADGARDPDLLVVTPDAPPPPPAAAPGDGTTLLPPAPASLPPSAPPADPDTACATISAAVEFVAQPVDIIIALDNSGSMDDEARAVEANINLNFAQILQESGVDYRLILVSEHRERSAQDTAVCILSPLSTLAACPSEAPGPSERFFQYSVEIGSDNSLDVLLETFDGSEEDDFGLAPGGWSEWLRPDAKKVFLEITDDNADGSVQDFLSALTALAPDHFGADPARPELVWHSIVGLAEQQIATDPYVATDPVQTAECDGDVFNAGATYQELSRLTGGLRFPICEFEGYDAVFRRIASDVVQGSSNACDFAVPAPPPGRALDLDKVAVSYSPGSGGAPRVFGRVSSSDACGADAFFVDDVGVHLCSEACDLVSVDASAGVDVLFTCENTLLR
jgi:hypothetical protein